MTRAEGETMNEKTKQDLARRAVACPGWRWMRGMSATWPDDGRPARRYGSPGETAGWVSDYSGKERIGWTDADALPDLDDPATLGCLLALVRGAWPKAPATIGHHGSYSPERGRYTFWACSYCTGGDWRQSSGATEAEALVAALEAAGGGS